MNIEHVEQLELTHTEIHIMQGLLNSLLRSDIISDEPLDKKVLYNLLGKLAEAHDSITIKMEHSL